MINAFVIVDASINVMKASLLEQTFCKTAACPSSEVLLRYRRHRLAISARLEIEMHLRECDFCSAELQLLTRHRTAFDQGRSEEIPVTLRRMAEELFVRPAGAFARREVVSNHRLSH